MPCPKCGSDNKVNKGKVKEKQRYKCKQCGCNYTQLYQHGYRLDKKLWAFQLYLEGNGLRGTGRILGLSNVTGSIGLNKQFGKNIKESVLGNMPHEIPDLEIVEIDERWHFTVKKRNYGPGLRSADLTRKSWSTPLAVTIRKPGTDYSADSVAIA